MNLPSAKTLAILTALAVSSPALAGEPSPALSGSYRYAGGTEETKALSAAIDGVVSQMSAVTRGIARSRLEKGNAPTKEVEIKIAKDNLTIARTGKPAISAPPDGKPVERNTTAGKQQVAYVIDGRKIVQTMHGKSSDSTNTYSLDADGTTLTIHTKIVSPRLPAPVEYHMTYKRK